MKILQEMSQIQNSTIHVLQTGPQMAKADRVFEQQAWF
jgi:hypothetical protein